MRTQQVYDYYKNLIPTLRGLLKKYNVPDNYGSQAQDAFTKNANIPLVLQARQEESDLMAQVDKILDLYDREWGKWRLDGNDVLRFDNPDASHRVQECQRYHQCNPRPAEKHPGTDVEKCKRDPAAIAFGAAGRGTFF